MGEMLFRRRPSYLPMHYDAVGVWNNDMPMTAEKVRASMMATETF